MLTHTPSITEEWVKENVLSVCLPAERSIIYIDEDRRGGVLSSTVWALPFSYCTSVCSSHHPRWPVLHFAFFHHKPWRISWTDVVWIFCFPSFHSVCLCLLLFFSHRVYPAVTFSHSCSYFYSSFISGSISTLSPISTYLSQFCLEEEVYHFIPILNKSEDVFLENIKY